VGTGRAPPATLRLSLMNPGARPPALQVRALPDAPKAPPMLGNADNGITVPPHGMVVQSLSRLLQSSKIIALNVTTSVGQVAAAVRESRSVHDVGGWLPATQAPARHLVIPGLPRASGTRTLSLAVPGSATAQLKMTLLPLRAPISPPAALASICPAGRQMLLHCRRWAECPARSLSRPACR